jgi:WD40 repeat protein
MNSKVLCAGTHEDIVIWDLNMMKKPLYRFEESHNDDVTGVQLQGNSTLISCSIDNVLSMFSLAANSTEEDMIQGAYSST